MPDVAEIAGCVVNYVLVVLFSRAQRRDGIIIIIIIIMFVYLITT